MRIDFTVDSFSNYDQLSAAQPSKGERLQTYGRRGVSTSGAGAKAEADEVILSGKAHPVVNAKEQEESVLEAAEQEMLGRLFPPGLFGNGVRAYRLAQGEPVHKLGKHIDTRT